MENAQSFQFLSIVNDAIEEISAELREISMQIHSHPEVGLQEHFAHKILTDYLESKGFHVTKHAYGIKTAFRAEFSIIGGKGRTVSFNSEYDALPEIGHACGHNLIAISGVAAAYGTMRAMKERNVPGKVVLFGTPAEEILAGKISMLELGAYKDVDINLMVHSAWFNGTSARYLACVMVNVEYFGVPAHAAAAPWKGKNALDAGVLAHNAISMLRQQIFPTDRIHGILTSGGTVVNVIPDYVSLRYLIRSVKVADLRMLKRRVQACFESAATATGCRMKIEWEKDCYDVIVNQKLASRFVQFMEKFGADYSPAQEPQTKGGSTDMGNVSHEVPGIHACFDIGTKYVIHSPDFAKAAKTELAHTNTMRAGKGLALTALDVLVDDAFYKEVYDEFIKVKPNL